LLLDESLNPAGEERLVSLARKGDTDAMAELIKLMAPLVNARAAFYSGSGIETEDLTQEGMLGFLNAVYSYSPEGGASFKTYVTVCVNNRMLSALRARRNKKRIPPKLECSLEHEDIAGEVEGADPQDILDAKEETQRLLNILNNELSLFEKTVLMQYLSGKRYEQIAKTTNSSPKAVDNALQRARRKLRQAENN
jgi:RNA polymerase sporulation-specific sigma factor